MTKYHRRRYNAIRNIPRPPWRKSLAHSDRALLSKLARAAKGGLISVSKAAEILGVSSRSAALKLASLARRGWLLRARRGLYLVLPLESEPGRPSVAEDPWVLAREAFPPCYIGGWSAAEHWGLTEQLFRSTLVITAASVRHRKVNLLGHEYRLFQVPRARITGSLVLVWRGAEQVLISGRERTIADGLRHPHLCGGLRQVAELLAAYKDSREGRLASLLLTMKEVDSGAAWKRLGYIAELLWPEESTLIPEIRKHLTAGNVRLDPNIPGRGKLVRRWRLWVNVPLTAAANRA